MELRRDRLGKSLLNDAIPHRFPALAVRLSYHLASDRELGPTLELAAFGLAGSSGRVVGYQVLDLTVSQDLARR